MTLQFSTDLDVLKLPTHRSHRPDGVGFPRCAHLLNSTLPPMHLLNGSLQRFVLPMLCAVFCLACCRPSAAFDAAANPAADVSESDIETRFVTRIREKAAEYRLARSNALVSQAQELAGAEYVRQAKLMLETGESQPLESAWHWLAPQWWVVSPSKERRSVWLGSDGFDAYPYTKAAGDLLAIQVVANARRGNISDMHNRLYELWYYIPDYNNMPNTMLAVMDATERTQNFTAAIDLEAEDPRKVIRLGGSSFSGEINRVFNFMVLHGDRVEIAPRAAIGLGRSLLRSGDKDDIFLARREYEKFCENYPTHSLIFTALCERALSYLVSYRGENYDVGVLISAAGVIDQAEIEAAGDPEKIKIVEAYRKRIRAWHQGRDLQVARWYRDRVTPGLSWLMAPKGHVNRPWLPASRYYYREVIRRDSGSEAGRDAQRELAELPLPTAAELGDSLPLPPAPVKP
jgi:hypothetical protein